MTQSKDFFKAYHDIMDTMIDEGRVVEEQHVTVAKLVQSAKEKGVVIGADKAWKIIQRKVTSGHLKPDGKRVDPKTGKRVGVWVVVEEEKQ